MPNLKLTVAGDSNVGLVRKNNEDYLTYFEPGDPLVAQQLGRLYIVADGVGGAATGEVASKYAARKVLYTYFHQPTLKPWQRIKAAMKLANLDLMAYIRQNAQARMATTMVAAALNGDEMTFVNVGDSRAYLFRSQQIRQITQDHNLVNEMIRNNVITEEQAKTARVKNQLTSSLGGHDVFKADVFVEKLIPGDLVILASDGFHRYAEDISIVQKLALSGTPEQIVNNGIQFARKSGGQDNITILVIRVDESIDFLPAGNDTGALPLALDLQTVVSDPLTLSARSPLQEETQSPRQPTVSLFRPDPSVPPIPVAEALSVPGLNMAYTDADMDDTDELGKRPPAAEETTAMIMTISDEDATQQQPVVLSRPAPAAAQTTPAQPAKKSLIERPSVGHYLLMILAALVIFVVLGILALTLGRRYLEQRSQPGANSLPPSVFLLNEQEYMADELVVDSLSGYLHR